MDARVLVLNPTITETSVLFSTIAHPPAAPTSQPGGLSATWILHGSSTRIRSHASCDTGGTTASAIEWATWLSPQRNAQLVPCVVTVGNRSVNGKDVTGNASEEHPAMLQSSSEVPPATRTG